MAFSTFILTPKHNNLVYIVIIVTEQILIDLVEITGVLAMALVRCPDCGKNVSSRVKQCPFCGCPSEFFEIAYVEQESEGNSHLDRDNTKSFVADNQNGKKMDYYGERDEVLFGYENEQNPNKDKYQFRVILDRERESDCHPRGRSHVIFRVGKSKYLTVFKADLFYAPIVERVFNKKYEKIDVFTKYIVGVNDLQGILKQVLSVANDLIMEYCEFLIGI